jgi:hypothetical protein
MTYEKGRFAFFDGSDPSFRTVLSAGDAIAGHTIREISADGVKLEREGVAVRLPVKAQLRREDEGEWRLASRGERYERSGRSGSRGSRDVRGAEPSPRETQREPTTNAGSASASNSNADVSEVLKRLMKQREEELK